MVRFKLLALKLCLVLITFLSFYTLFNTPSFACSTSGLLFPPTVSGCQSAQCGGDADQGSVTYTYTDSTTCTQLEYFIKGSTCSQPTSNPCPSQCNPADQSTCTCAGGGTSATDYCVNGSIGNPPYWCQGFSCGYNCDNPAAGPSSCRKLSKGDGIGDFGSSLECTNWCKTGYSCINNSCQGGIVGADFGTLAECRATGCGDVASPPPTPPPSPPPTPPPGCKFCGTYTDNWSCSGAPAVTKQCDSYAPAAGNCATDAGTGGCNIQCGACQGGSHLACVNNTCTSVSGAGSNTCSPVGSSCGGPVCSGTFCSGDQCRQYRSCGDSFPVADNLCKGGAGCGGTCDLGQSAGCNNPGQTTCCKPGLTCRNNTCQADVPPPPWCDFPDLGTPHQITPGWDENGSPSAITNWDPNTSPPASRRNHVDFKFNWSDTSIHGSACTGQGRMFRITIGVCEDGVTKYDGAKCNSTPYYIETTPRTNDWPSPREFSWVETTPGQARFTIPRDHVGFWQVATTDTSGNPTGNWVPKAACWNGAGTNCTPGELPPLIGGKRSHTYWYQISGDCSCNGFQSPKSSPTWIFTYDLPVAASQPPAAPTLICQTVGSSGDTHDICDKTISPPISPSGPVTGYGNASRYDLNVRDGGPVGPRQPFYSHRFSVLDTTQGTLQTVAKPFGALGINGLTDLATPLQNGHRYSWNVMTSDTGSPPNPTPDSPLATNGPWEFLYDLSNPNGSIIGLSNGACYDPTTLPPTFTVSASDPIPGGPPNEASDVSQIVLTTNGTGSGNIIATCTSSGVNPKVWSCTRSTSFVTNPPSAGGDIYNLTVGTTDNAGNIGTSANTRFIYKSACIGPWLQTTSGDVHSNNKVNTPGGPL